MPLRDLPSTAPTRLSAPREAGRSTGHTSREAQRDLGGPSELSIVPGAAHPVEKPGALDEVARQAAEWFERHLALSGAARGMS